ncbi:MAG: CPBP family intramembrane metalloprotease [Blastocatellia bacterium]|nr:CPBP family intramembrane metalloprotease [Blastocatellia bacterium]MCS7156602.1 CPBP family intramembrane metalloprotease [Blastocatellia bacterium]MCX7751656.1 CPBP family intramembrane metalloprotease [Blastocatellia bacterium]MDW8168756.1 CPBP family intramembrane glutamic endopeptidase [Acidobacteriota bacterium]MDW8257022.1 CPBP family intramembrane glutamic endopeptidase [Acidobacteriota bacterium]
MTPTRCERLIVGLLLLVTTGAFSIYALQEAPWRLRLSALLAFALFFWPTLLLGTAEGREKLVAFVRRDDALRHANIFLLVFALTALAALSALALGQFRWEAVWACAAYLLIPTVALTVRRPNHEGFTLQDALAIVALWFPIEFEWLPLAEIPRRPGIGMDKLLGVMWLLVLFLGVRRLEGIGYTFLLGRADVARAGLYFALFVTFFAIPLAIPTHFVASSPAMRPLSEIGPVLLATAFLIALPEELLFRGVMLNLLVRRWQEHPMCALAIASLIFGFAHANNPDEPTWVYVVLATIAGWFYGLAYLRTGKVTVAAFLHWMVNSYWGIFFHR